MLAHPQLWATPAAAGKRTLSVTTEMDGGRTCWAGHHPHQPAEVSRWLNHSYHTANKPERGILFVYNGMGKAGAGLRCLDLGSIFPISWGLLHSLPSVPGQHWLPQARDHQSWWQHVQRRCGNKKEKRRGYGILRAYEIVFPKEGWGGSFTQKNPLAKDSVKSLGQKCKL